MSPFRRSPEAVEDRALADLFLANGDEAAFRALYGRHAGALHRFTTRLSGSPSDGEDLLQEAWILAAERLGEFRWESSLRTWLCGIAVNRWRELCRRRTRERAGAAAAGDARHPPPERSGGSRIDLERAIGELADGYREVLVLHDLQGYTHEEIGGMLEIEPASSRSQLSRARRSLRARLAPSAGAGKEHP